MKSIQEQIALFKLPIKKRTSQRAELVRYFHERARNKDGEPFNVSYIAYRLGHLNLQDLYYLKSVCESESRRGTNWNKVFFGSLKVGINPLQESTELA